MLLTRFAPIKQTSAHTSIAFTILEMNPLFKLMLYFIAAFQHHIMPMTISETGSTGKPLYFTRRQREASQCKAAIYAYGVKT
jgi:hypothetical protein